MIEWPSNRRFVRGAIIASLPFIMCQGAAASAGTPPCTCIGDSSGDGLVNVSDLLDAINTWGACPLPCPPMCAPDFDLDCDVDVEDLLALLNSWGACPPPGIEPGPSIMAARDLGTLAGTPMLVCEHIGPGDTDVYRFEITSARMVNIALTDRVSGINAMLLADLDGDGMIDGEDDLETIAAALGNDISMSEDLVPGVYHLRVLPHATNYTAYALRVTSSMLPALNPDPTGSLPTAHAMGTLGDTAIERRDLVGGYDAVDVYAFTLADHREVSIGLLERTEGLNLTLIADINNNGMIDAIDDLEVSAHFGSNDIIIGEDLVPGQYFAVIAPYDADRSTRYLLRLTAASLAITTASDPAISLPISYDLGTIDPDAATDQATLGATEVLEVVGGHDTLDVYRFTLSAAADLSVGLLDRTEGANLTLIADINGNGSVDSNDDLEFTGHFGANDATLFEDLAPGAYHLVVQPYDADRSTRYRLRLIAILLPIDTTSDPPSPPAAMLAPSYDLGAVGPAGIEVHEVVGGHDASDLYRFTIAGPGKAEPYTIGVLDRTEGATIALHRDLNNDGMLSGGETLASSGHFGGNDVFLSPQPMLSPGTYFIRLGPYDADRSTRYLLRLVSP